VGEEHVADQLPAAYAGFLEGLLEVLPDGVRGNDEALGDLGGRLAAKDQPGDLLFALGEPIRAGCARSTITAAAKPEATRDVP